MLSIILAILLGLHRYYIMGLSLYSSILYFLIWFTIAIGLNYFFYTHTIIEVAWDKIKYKKSGDIGVLPLKSVRKKKIYYEIGYEGSEKVYKMNVFDGKEGGPITFPVNVTKIIHGEKNPRVDIYEAKKYIFTNILLNVIPTKITMMKFEVYLP